MCCLFSLLIYHLACKLDFFLVSNVSNIVFDICPNNVSSFINKLYMLSLAFSLTFVPAWTKFHVELIVFVGSVKDIRAVISQFLVVLYVSVYNCILGWPFTAMLDVVASLIHLKLKYHNIQGESTTINAYLERAKWIYRAL